MKANFEQFIATLNVSSLSVDVLRQITFILKEQTDDSLPLFISQVFESLLILERWAWQKLSQESFQCVNQTEYEELLHILVLFNKQIIFIDNNIEDNIKFSLLIPETIDQINLIFEQVKQCTNDHNSFITLVSLWFDNLSFLVQEYPQLGHSPIIIYINQYFEENFVLSKLFKSYLIQLHQSELSPSIFTSKQLFYIKTCSFSLTTYFYTKPQNFSFITNEILQQHSNIYLQIIQIHSYTIQFWSKELLTCIRHLTGLICACYSLNKIEDEINKILFPNENILIEYVKALIRIISYVSFCKEIKTIRLDDEAMLLDIILFFLMNIVQTQNINWYFRSMTQLPDILLLLRTMNKSIPYQYLFYVYSILGELLTDEKLKELQFNDNMSDSYFYMLEQAWQQPSKTYKHISISLLLRGICMPQIEFSSMTWIIFYF
ncbi:unnamed protein product [Rotaria sp. Silwood2]|nr:unnamed protein product [Rotaria sp. Silwood2]CAF4577312.1 unnamed protein product [Rotaria sp. Silwood2]